MNLIDQIKNDILDDSKHLASILRKAKVFASTIKNDELLNWVDNELRGYGRKNNDKVPDYRKMNSENYGSFSGPFGSGLKNHPIPISHLPEYAKEFAANCLFSEGVSEYESLLNGKAPVFNINWPPDLIASVQSDTSIYINMNLYHAYQQISRGEVVGMLDTIRNNLLDFIFELEMKYPDLVKTIEGIKKIPNETITSIFHTNVYGSHNLISTAENISQNIQINVLQNDIPSLREQLIKIGLAEEEVQELESAINKDGNIGKNGIGLNVGKWIGETIKKIAVGTIKLAVDKIPNLIINAIYQFYGIEL